MVWTDHQLERWISLRLVDSEGDRVGTISDVYVDDASGEPEWLAVMTGLFGSRISFLPLEGAIEGDGEIHTPWLKSQIKDSPNIDADGELSADEEVQLYSHYGVLYREDRGGSSAERAAGGLEPSTAGSASMTDVSPELARARLRRRDAAAVSAIDLKDDDIDSAV